MTTADILIETLINWGVDTIFGFPGDGINGVFESIRTHSDQINFIQVRHEEAAAFMATGYAKFTGRLGVCVATSGPGGIHLLNGLYDAKMDGQPVLAITGMSYHDLIGTHGQQDVEMDKLFMDVAIYNQRVMGPTHVQTVTEIACRTAETFRGVAHITIPKDIQDMSYHPSTQSSKRNPGDHVSTVHTDSISVPRESQIHRAAELLNEAKKVCILAGRGALHATDELEQVAEILGAPIVKALLGKAAVPDDSPYTTGSIGLLGTKPSEEALRNCDLLFMVGTAFDYGFLDMAKQYLERIFDLLTPYAERDISIVVLEPSCWSVLRDEIHGLFPGRKATQQIMQNTFLLSEFLVEKAKYHPPRMHREAVVHGHCHHKAIIKGAEHEEKLLEDMQMNVRVLSDGCCGMAGSFGFESEHYDMSAQVGERALLPHVRQAGRNEILIADGFSCREQISQMTDRTGLHMAEVLQLAIQHGPAGPDELRPEQTFVDEYQRAIRKSKLQAAAMIGGAAAVAAAILGAQQISRNNRSVSSKH